MKKTLLMAALAAAVVGGALGCGGKDAKDKPATAVDTAAVAADTVAAVPDTATTFTDTRDGKVYRRVKIGTQFWMAENLNYAVKGRCYGEGSDVIVGWTKNDGYITKTLSNAEVQDNCTKYGRLYNWETALTACPAGTHLPSDDEWTALVDYVGGEEKAGTKFKSSTGWGPSGRVPTGTDEYGFSALSGGGAYGDGLFDDAGNFGDWWSATEVDTDDASFMRMGYDGENVSWSNGDKTLQLSVRCVADD